MRRRLIRIAVILLVFPPLLAAIVGWLVGPGFLHPIRRELTPELIREAGASLAVTGSRREDFEVRAPDGVLLRGWKVRPPQPNGSWVLLFHGVADNRVGVIGHSEFLLRGGYSVVMMDARAHGASEGPIATYGWLERNDTHAIIDQLIDSEVSPGASVQWGGVGGSPCPAPAHIFALGESMARASRCNPLPAIPALKPLSPRLPSPAFAKLPTTTLASAGLRFWEKLFSRPSVGR